MSLLLNMKQKKKKTQKQTPKHIHTHTYRIQCIGGNPQTAQSGWSAIPCIVFRFMPGTGRNPLLTEENGSRMTVTSLSRGSVESTVLGFITVMKNQKKWFYDCLRKLKMLLDSLLIRKLSLFPPFGINFLRCWLHLCIKDQRRGRWKKIAKISLVDEEKQIYSSC